MALQVSLVKQKPLAISCRVWRSAYVCPVHHCPLPDDSLLASRACSTREAPRRHGVSCHTLRLQSASDPAGQHIYAALEELATWLSKQEGLFPDSFRDFAARVLTRQVRGEIAKARLPAHAPCACLSLRGAARVAKYLEVAITVRMICMRV
jgi:hypothetical protein